MLLCMTKPRETRVIEVYASVTGSQIRLTWRRWSHKYGEAERLNQVTRMVIATLPVPPTNDDLSKYCEAMARFCVDPRRRAFKPPNALVWREVAFGDDQTHEHGELRDGRHFIQDPLPPFEGSTTVPQPDMILPGAKPGDAAPPKAGRPTAREPQIRELGKGRRRSVPGG